MSDPLISAVCVTYARTKHVEEAIACFISQGFGEKAELLILNTFPEQHLECDDSVHPINVINLGVRPDSLADARNIAIGEARGKIIVTWDDDCIYLPDHLKTIFSHFDRWAGSPDPVSWVWLKSMFMLERGHITKAVQASENTLAFTKDAWEKVGQYQTGLSVGEDRNFSGKITSSFRGILVPVKPEEITFLYGWDNGSYHISGHGWEAKGSTAYEKVRKTVQQQVAAGEIPTGRIELQPKLNTDYKALVKSFLNSSAPQPDEQDVCIVQLGRFGDCINALPIAKAIYDRTGRKPYWMISREFESLLEGVSYVEPYPVSFTFHELNAAMIHANGLFNRVIKTQIYGQNRYQNTHQPSWPQESWYQAGFIDHFHSKDHRLVFDQRDHKREAALRAKLFRTTKPKIITNLTSAVSVPFGSGDKMLAAIMLEFGKQYEVIDIGKLRTERIYDLIGIYEHASVIVSIDTATMHLAAAVEAPLVALVNPSHWLGPQLRYNCAARIPYSQATIKTVCDAIREAPDWMKKQNHRDDVLRLLAKPVTSEEKLDLSDVCLWGCAWSDDENNLLRTLRVLRYCHSIINFGDIVMLSYLPLPDKLGFPVRRIQIPPLSPESWNVFHVHTLPHILPDRCGHYMSIHEDGFPLDVNQWCGDFWDYDYIGAPWPDGLVGNGGFCMESRALLEAKSQLPFMRRLHQPVGTTFGMLHFTPSDDYICRDHRATLEKKGMKFAPAWAALQFSTELTGKDAKSFGYHGRRATPEKYAKGWQLIEESEK